MKLLFSILCWITSEWMSFWQIIATLLVGIATIFIYIRITNMSSKTSIKVAETLNKHTSFCKLNEDLNRIVEYTIQYPYVDDETYKENYTSDLKSSDEIKRREALRYEAFAIMTFNFISDLVSYYNGKEEDMFRYCDYKELIIAHKKYWEHRVLKEKESGYESIQDIVNKVLQETDTII